MDLGLLLVMRVQIIYMCLLILMIIVKKMQFRQYGGQTNFDCDDNDDCDNDCDCDDACNDGCGDCE